MGFIVRSQFSQNLEEEQASLFHAAKEVCNKKNDLSDLKINGNVCSNPNEIEKEVINYFHALFNGHHNRDMVNTGSPFTPDNSGLSDLLQDLSSLDDNQRSKLEEDIDIEEMDIIVSECANNKAPGLDGISYEFYKATWSIIRKPIVMVLQCQLDRLRLID